MQTYSEFQPTGFDPRGLALDDRQDWLVAPVGLNRDSGILERSNWEVLTENLDRIDPEGADHEVHRFGHWACGWFEIVIVRPDSKCAVKCEESEAALANYPVLSDEHHSRLESEDVQDAWNRLSIRGRVELCQFHKVNPLAARRGTPPDDDELRDSLRSE